MSAANEKSALRNFEKFELFSVYITAILREFFTEPKECPHE